MLVEVAHVFVFISTHFVKIYFLDFIFLFKMLKTVSLSAAKTAAEWEHCLNRIEGRRWMRNTKRTVNSFTVLKRVPFLCQSFVVDWILFLGRTR